MTRSLKTGSPLDRLRGAMLFLLLAALPTRGAWARFVDVGEGKAGRSPHGSSYIVPNETFPQISIPILKHAGPGVYVSVGTERGLFGAIQTPGATHLLLLDMDPEVVRFNRINIALLEMAKDRADYLSLRNASDRKLWLEPERLQRVEPSLREALTPESFTFWRGQMKNFENFSRGFTTNGQEFKGVNYLFSDRAFRRIHALARGGKIQAEQGNLLDPARMEEIAAAMKQRGLELSVLDFSNAWDTNDYYLDGKQVAQLLETLDPVSHRDSMFFLTMYGKTNSFGFRWKRFADTPEKKLALGKAIALPPGRRDQARIELAGLGLPDVRYPPYGTLDHVSVVDPSLADPTCHLPLAGLALDE